MGCLNVEISNKNARDIKVGVAAKNTTPAVSVLPVQAGFEVASENRNTLLVISIGNRNADMKVTATGRNADMEVTVGLVCQVGLNYKVFYVDEGPFLVEEGYFKVK